jgi:cell wall-associated NlpC family hydrolase
MITMAISKRDEVIAIAKSREGKNKYTQGAKRTQVGNGWSDCSSFVRWCYLQVRNQDIGINTAAQITNKDLTIVD